MRTVDRYADAAAHGDAVHQGNIGLGVMFDLSVQRIFDAEEIRRSDAIRATTFGDLADITTGAKPTRPVGVIDHDGAHRRVGFPGGQRLRHGHAHLNRQGMQGFRSIERNATDTVLDPRNDLVRHAVSIWRAMMTRMISLVPSSI